MPDPEDPVEIGAEPAEHRIQGGDHRDRQVGVERQGYVGTQHQPEHDPHEQPQGGDHEVSFSLSGPAWSVSAHRSRRRISGAAGSWSSLSFCRLTTKPN